MINFLVLSAFAVIAVLYFVTDDIFESLKSRHPKVYESMGKPQMGGGKLVNSASIWWFVFLRRYKPLNDQKLSRQCLLLFLGLLYFIGVSFVVMFNQSH